MPGAPSDDRGPVGVVLAGGLGRRIGGDKAVVLMGGRPLVSYGLAALREAFASEPVVVAKSDTELPALPAGVRVWVEPDEPRHPLTGIVRALECAGGRDVVVLAVDLPLVTPVLLRALVEEAGPRGGSPVVVARAGGRMQPLCAVYAASVLPLLRAAPVDGRLNSIIEGMGAVAVDVADADALLNVNTPGDARRAQALLAAQG